MNAYIHTEKASFRIEGIGAVDMPTSGESWLVIYAVDSTQSVAVVSLTDGTFVTFGEDDPALKSDSA